jgi:hypothetical protein
LIQLPAISIAELGSIYVKKNPLSRANDLFQGCPIFVPDKDDLAGECFEFAYLEKKGILNIIRTTWFQSRSSEIKKWKYGT